MGNEATISRYFPNSEFIFEWRSDINKIDFDGEYKD